MRPHESEDAVEVAPDDTAGTEADGAGVPDKCGDTQEPQHVVPPTEEYTHNTLRYHKWLQAGGENMPQLNEEVRAERETCMHFPHLPKSNAPANEAHPKLYFTYASLSNADLATFNMMTLGMFAIDVHQIFPNAEEAFAALQGATSELVAQRGEVTRHASPCAAGNALMGPGPLGDKPEAQHGQVSGCGPHSHRLVLLPVVRNEKDMRALFDMPRNDSTDPMSSACFTADRFDHYTLLFSSDGSVSCLVPEQGGDVPQATEKAYDADAPDADDGDAAAARTTRAAADAADAGDLAVATRCDRKTGVPLLRPSRTPTLLGSKSALLQSSTDRLAASLQNSAKLAERSAVERATDDFVAQQVELYEKFESEERKKLIEMKEASKRPVPTSKDGKALPSTPEDIHRVGKTNAKWAAAAFGNARVARVNMATAHQLARVKACLMEYIEQCDVQGDRVESVVGDMFPPVVAPQIPEVVAAEKAEAEREAAQQGATDGGQSDAAYLMAECQPIDLDNLSEARKEQIAQKKNIIVIPRPTADTTPAPVPGRAAKDADAYPFPMHAEEQQCAQELLETSGSDAGAPAVVKESASF